MRRVLGVTLVLIWSAMPGVGQTGSETAGTTGCTLKNHVYTCDKTTFETALASAKTTAVETHSVDRLAAAQLSAMLTKKLGKMVVPDGSATDLIFLMIPVGVEGISMSPGETDLGTLRIYSANADGTRAHLLWAEDFFGQQDLPWPAVVHSLIAQFQGHFRIK